MSTQKEFGFRSSVGGYHKGEVHAYIAKIAKDFAKQNEEWELERAKLQREIQNGREDIRKNEHLREELTCQYLDALSKIDRMMEHLSAEQQKNEELLAEKESNLQRMEQLELFEKTKEALAKAKISLSLEQKRVGVLQKEKDSMASRLETLEASLAASEETIRDNVRDHKTLTAENQALRSQLEAMETIVSTSKEIMETEQKRTEAREAKIDSLRERLSATENALAQAQTDASEALAAERKKNDALSDENLALNEQLRQIQAQREAEQALPEQAAQTAAQAEEAEKALAQARAEIEKLRADLIQQNRSERIAYAHTNTFFIMEEKMGRFYRDAMYASESKIGL